MDTEQASLTTVRRSILIYKITALIMDDLDRSYWQGDEPRTSLELNNQIAKAIDAIRQWKNAADIQDSESDVMIDAQIVWLEQLLKLADVEMKGL